LRSIRHTVWGNRVAQGIAAAAVLLWAPAAFASITQGVNGPGEGEIGVESISVGTQVTSSVPLTEVKVTIGGVTTPLTAVGPGYGAVVPLAALPEGPLTAVVTATNTLGESVSTARTFIHDRRPTISVASPKPWFFRSSPAAVRVTVSCADTAAYPCDHITVPGLGNVPGASMDQDVPVPASATSLTIDVVDTLGIKSSTTIPLAYDATPTLSLLHTMPGRVLDMDATRVLYTNASGLWIRDLATGTDTRAGDDVGDTGTGALTLTSAVHDERWVSGNQQFYVSGIAKNGNAERPTVTDALTGATFTCDFGQKPYDPITRVVGVSDSGSVQWFTPNLNLPGLMTWRCGAPGGLKTISLDPPYAQNDAMTSGAVYVYARNTWPVADLAPIVCVRESGNPAPCGQLAPTVSQATLPSWMSADGRLKGRARLDFDTSCGWTGFTKLVGSQLQAFIQSPTGVVSPRGPTSVASLGGIAPNGELVVSTGLTQYLTREGQPTVTFSTTRTRAKWVEGRWLGFSGSAILASSESLPGGPAYCNSVPAPDGGAPVVDAGAPSDAGPVEAGMDGAGDAGSASKPDATLTPDGGAPASSSSSSSGTPGASSGGSSASDPSDDPGGCSTSTGGSTGAGALGALAALGLLVHRRRARSASHRAR